MTVRVSSLVTTVGTRVGFLARTASMGRSSGVLSTSRYREEQGAERLILGRRRHVLLDDQVCQKRLDFCARHLVGMAWVMEEHVTCHPGDLGFLRTNRGVLEPDGIAHVVKKLLGTGLHG